MCVGVPVQVTVGVCVGVCLLPLFSLDAGNQGFLTDLKPQLLVKGKQSWRTVAGVHPLHI